VHSDQVAPAGYEPFFPVMTGLDPVIFTSAARRQMTGSSPIGAKHFPACSDIVVFFAAAHASVV
jgi:hypothetical protein